MSYTVSNNRKLLLDGNHVMSLCVDEDIFRFLTTINLDRQCSIYRNVKEIEKGLFETDYYKFKFDNFNIPVLTMKDDNVVLFDKGFYNINDTNHDGWNECVDHHICRLYFDYDDPIDIEERTTYIKNWIKSKYNVDIELYVLKNNKHEKYHIISNLSIPYTLSFLILKEMNHGSDVNPFSSFLRTLRAPYRFKYRQNCKHDDVMEIGIYEPYPSINGSLRNYYITPLPTDIYIDHPIEYPIKKILNKENNLIDIFKKGIYTGSQDICSTNFIYVDNILHVDFKVERYIIPIEQLSKNNINYKLCAIFYKYLGETILKTIRVIISNSKINDKEIKQIDYKLDRSKLKIDVLDDHPTDIYFEIELDDNSLVYVNNKHIFYTIKNETIV
jgi:hypothetical protein